MKKDYDVALRGHHLIFLYQFHFSEGEEKAREGAFKFILRVKYNYKKKHVDHAIDVLKKITKSDVRVKIVDTLDDVCKKCHRKKLGDCSGIEDARDDKRIAAHADLMIGKIYSSKDILENLRIASKNKLSIFYRQG